MVGLSMMPVQTYFLNGLILFLVDGYLNVAIWSYMQFIIQRANLMIRKKESQDLLVDFDIQKQIVQEAFEVGADIER